MPNRSETDFSEKVPSGKIKGKTKAKHKMIAELIARGFSVKEVAKTVKLSESQISHLLSDEDSFVNREISRIISNFFAENDRLLVNLYNKALQKLDELLSSPKQKIQLQAIDRVFKILVARSAQKEEEGRPETIDDWTPEGRRNEGTLRGPIVRIVLILIQRVVLILLHMILLQVIILKTILLQMVLLQILLPQISKNFLSQ